MAAVSRSSIRTRTRYLSLTPRAACRRNDAKSEITYVPFRPVPISWSSIARIWSCAVIFSCRHAAQAAQVNRATTPLDRTHITYNCMRTHLATLGRMRHVRRLQRRHVTNSRVFTRRRLSVEPIGRFARDFWTARLVPTNTIVRRARWSCREASAFQLVVA